MTKKVMNSFLALVCMAECLVVSACDPVAPPTVVIAKSTGLFVLCEGGFGKNNSEVSYYNQQTKQVTNDLFQQKNKELLGDTGNDMLQYGGKIYMVVNGSGKVEVVNARTFKREKQISFLDGSKNKNPRNAVGTLGKVFVSNWDGTVSVIDTMSLTIEKNINLTISSPEKMVVVNGKLYVVGSGDYSADYSGGGIAVVNLTSMTQEKVIDAGLNLGDIAVDGSNNLYVVKRGLYDQNYNLIDPHVVVVSTNTGAVTETLSSFDALEIELVGNNLYALTREKTSDQTFASHLLLYDIATKKVVNSKFEGTTAITNIYHLSAIGDTLYVSDSKDFQSQGELFVFDKTGKSTYSFKVGINPSVVLKANLGE